MLLNLLSNAIKFTPYGGQITVIVRKIKEAHELSFDDASLVDKVVNHPDKQFLEIQVQDTGIGIHQNDMPKLFKLFGFLESTKQINSKGIGLGLHITKKITKMFNGNIICRSKFGNGSNFIFIVALENYEIDSSGSI